MAGGVVAVVGEIVMVRVEPSRVRYLPDVRMLIRATIGDGGLYRCGRPNPSGAIQARPGGRGALSRRFSRSDTNDLRLRQAAPKG